MISFRPLALALTFALAAPLFAASGNSIVRINSTLQNYSPSQPWEKTSPRKRRGLGALLPDNRVLTTAAMAADAIYLEFESADSTRSVPAKVLAVDYDANLALLIPQESPGFLSELTPTSLGGISKPGDSLDILQLENKGTIQTTSGIIRSMELLSTFVSGRYFLCYEVKASMQTEGNSFTLPAFRDGKLAGILTSYNSKEQICDIISIDIISAFLADAADGQYQGFPSLGTGYSTTEDPHFRAWLKLPEDQGGLYISRVLPGGSAEAAGLQKGDVLLSIAGHAIDRKGYYKHADYGALFWTHIVRGAHQVGEEVDANVLREGKPLTLKLKLKKSPEPLIPEHLFGQAPPFLIKGGLVFQELSRPYLQAFGKEWASRAPLNLLEVYNNQNDHKNGHRRIVVLTRVIPTQATIGYERISSRIVTSVNGKTIAGLPELISELAQTPDNGIHEIEIDDVPYKIHLDQNLADNVDQQFKARGLPSLSRTYPVQ